MLSNTLQNIDENINIKYKEKTVDIVPVGNKALRMSYSSE